MAVDKPSIDLWRSSTQVSDEEIIGIYNPLGFKPNCDLATTGNVRRQKIKGLPSTNQASVAHYPQYARAAGWRHHNNLGVMNNADTTISQSPVGRPKQ